jgi:hypothetical protein
MNIEEFDYNIDINKVLLWQYNNSPSIQELVFNKNIWTALFGTLFWEDWQFIVFDLRTADLFGLTVWSIILDLPLFVPVSNESPVGVPIWGYNVVNTPAPPPDLENSNLNYDHGNLAGALVVPTLTQEEQRVALQLRYYQLVSRGAVTEVNQFLNYLFGSQGGAWMIDNFDMTITYEFGFPISGVLLSVISAYQLLPKPAGVAVNYIVPP